MPSLSQISNNFFINLITRLGVRPPPSEAFLLSNIVQPVSIVDTDVPLQAIATTQTLDSPFTNGRLVNAAANAILADTGALAAGTYSVFVTSGKLLGVSNFDYSIQRRDAANAVTVWEIMGLGDGSSQSTLTWSFTCVLLINERIRVIENTVSTATAIVNIWALKVA